MKVVIVGAGMTGAIAARRLTDLDHNVTVVERRNHIGGNCYDEVNQEGILIQKYGPHHFHSNNKKIWQFLNYYAKFIEFPQMAGVYIDKKIVPFPINQYSELILGRKLNKKEILKKIFKNYSKKMWGKNWDELPLEIKNRVPKKQDRFTMGYYASTYMGVPKLGYNYLFKKLLKGVPVLLNTDFLKIKNNFKDHIIIYTGSIDEYYNYKFGQLEYRTIKTKYKTLNRRSYQDYHIVYYPPFNKPYIKIIEFKKYYLDLNNKKTTIGFCYAHQAQTPDERLYPINILRNKNLYQKYLNYSKNDNIIFCGRLGDYKYYHMDEAGQRAFDIVEEIKNG